jgi:hypothetical protein
MRAMTDFGDGWGQAAAAWSCDLTTSTPSAQCTGAKLPERVMPLLRDATKGPWRGFGVSSSTLLLGRRHRGGRYLALRFALGEVTERGHQTTEDQTRQSSGKHPTALPGALSLAREAARRSRRCRGALPQSYPNYKTVHRPLSGLVPA